MTDPFMNPIHVQGSAEWLAHRKNFIGASDAPIIMGDSPWKTPYQLWEDKLGMSPPQEETWAMKRGTEMEPLARKAFEDATGLEVFPQVVYHLEHSFMMASMDGVSIDGSAAVEIKCPGQKAHECALSGEVPHYYMPQLQHQLACIGLEMLWYYSYDGTNGVALKVYRDDGYIECLIEEEKKFWNCVETSTPPSLTDKDYEVREGATWCAYAHRVEEIDTQLSALKQERDQIRAILIDDSDGRNSRCGPLTLSKSFSRGRIDYDAIPELQGVNLEQYRKKAKEQWVMKFSRKKER